jgi:hypothetical protein
MRITNPNSLGLVEQPKGGALIDLWLMFRVGGGGKQEDYDCRKSLRKDAVPPLPFGRNIPSGDN